jgi:hypothetical protein
MNKSIIIRLKMVKKHHTIVFDKTIFKNTKFGILGRK